MVARSLRSLLLLAGLFEGSFAEKYFENGAVCVAQQVTVTKIVYDSTVLYSDGYVTAPAVDSKWSYGKHHASSVASSASASVPKSGYGKPGKDDWDHDGYDKPGKYGVSSSSSKSSKSTPVPNYGQCVSELYTPKHGYKASKSYAAHPTIHQPSSYAGYKPHSAAEYPSHPAAGYPSVSKAGYEQVAYSKHSSSPAPEPSHPISDVEHTSRPFPTWSHHSFANSSIPAASSSKLSSIVSSSSSRSSTSTKSSSASASSSVSSESSSSSISSSAASSSSSSTAISSSSSASSSSSDSSSASSSLSSSSEISSSTSSSVSSKYTTQIAWTHRVSNSLTSGAESSSITSSASSTISSEVSSTISSTSSASPPPAVPGCPYPDGSCYITNLNNYVTTCNLCYPTAAFTEGSISYDACIALCDLDTMCTGVSWIFGAPGVNVGDCFLQFGDVGPPTLQLDQCTGAQQVDSCPT